MSMLKKAEAKNAYAKIGLYGDAGSGKTLTAAKIAIGLHQYGKLKKPVAFFDTEPAASWIIPLFEEAKIPFYVYDESRALADLMKYVDEAERECSILIVDSITHVWRDAQDSFIKKINAKRKQQRKPPINQLEFHHWRPIKAAWMDFTERFLSSHLHFIVCGRAGSIYEYQKNDETGRMELITTGTKMATEKELGYEPSLLIEMVKHRQQGKIINRALIEKDRSQQMNGAEIDFPDFKDFMPHMERLNLGGAHTGNMNARDSVDMYPDSADDDGFGYEKRQREIWCEEIKGLLITYSLDGSGSDAKKKRVSLLDDIFGTKAWTRIESMPSERIKAGYELMKEKLAKPEPTPETEAPGDE